MDSFDDVPDTTDTVSKVRGGLAEEVERQAKQNAKEIDTRELAQTAIFIGSATAVGVVLTGAVTYLIDSATK